MQISKKDALIFSLNICLTAGIGTRILSFLADFVLILFGYEQYDYPKSLLYKEAIHQNIIGPLIANLLIMLPLFATLFFSLRNLSKSTTPLNKIKKHLSLLGVICAFLPSTIGLIYTGSISRADPSYRVYTIPYVFTGVCFAILTIMGIWFYKIETETDAS